MNKPEISIIIGNWNGINVLPACLKSIVENAPSVSYEIILIDNASSDESVEWLKSREVKKLLDDTKFTLIESEENLGFSRANNFAIEQTNSPYVFLLNPDTIVKPHAIDKLLQTLKSDKKIGAVAPKLFNEDGTIQFNVWGFPPTPFSLLTGGLKLYHLLPKKLISGWLYSMHWDYKERKHVPMFSGAAILVKREMIDEIGAFDTDFFMFGEDGEWCVRMNRNGWKTFFEPEAEIIHIGRQSSLQKWGTETTLLKEEEAFIFFQKKCLSKYLLSANLLTRGFILSTYYIKDILFRKKKSISGSLIKLQFKELKSTIKQTVLPDKINHRNTL